MVKSVLINTFFPNTPHFQVMMLHSSGKYSLAVAVGKEAQAKGLAAGRLAKEIASVAGGNGGGKPDFAMAGIRDASKIDDALNAVPGIVEKVLNA